MIVRHQYREALLSVAVCLAMLTADAAFGQAPPVLNTVFPAGGHVARSVEVVVSGSNLQGLRTLHCNVPGFQCDRLETDRFRLTIPAGTPPGLCDLWAVGDNGVSAPRTFAIRNLIGGLQADPRRTYRLSVRREEPDFQLVAVPHRDDPASLNVPRGGREVLDLLVFRRRGFDGSIRVSAKDLPAGVECPDVWLGPGIDRATVVVSADRNAAAVVGELKLAGVAEEAGQRSSTLRVELLGSGEPSYSRRSVRSGTFVRSGMPKSWGRITRKTPSCAISTAGTATARAPCSLADWSKRGLAA